ncbi:NAD-dependent epimerase/dehydratase family protein, partial [bacterium]|nr:NAD-dependent epimerase/dehydratase family protein [bacterium]
RLADDNFTPVLLRNATVYGVSPRLRLDVVVNDFVGSAVTIERVAMRSAGAAWRPLIHVEDLARVYAAALIADRELVHAEVFNVVGPEGNHRVIDIADTVADLVPPAVRSSSEGAYDERSYRVSAAKLQRILPRLRLGWSLPNGIRQLRDGMIGAGITLSDWRSDRFRRSLRLRRLIERGEVQPDLRSRQTVPA